MNYFARILLCLIFFSLSTITYSQIINAYARGTNITGGVTIDVDNVDQANDNFVVGEYVFIMQMQDDVIGTTADVATFGDVGAFNNAGRFEVRQIVNLIGGATPTQIVVDAPLTYTYNHSSNARFQVVSFPSYGAPDYSTTGNFQAKAWSGETGGVLAFFCPGILTLNHLLQANAKGFSGGAANLDGSALGCSPFTYRIANGVNFADKGEGMYRIDTATNPEFVAGRGRILNGGGGGNSHNGGGGGGGNYTNGGDGGPGWKAAAPGYCDPSSAGGFGGYGLGVAGENIISNTRLFMGGGGGAGEGNNNLATTGGRGGGIVFIQAQELRTVAGCANGDARILSNGQASILAAGNDGGGGGGGGGSVILEINTFTVDCGCPLIVRANGGPGGDVANSATHGGGGGGGQGVISFSNPSTPTGCVTIETNNGVGGANDNTGSGFSAGDGGGTNGDGILTGFSALPAEIGLYAAVCLDDSRLITWETLSEDNTDYFNLERSYDNVDWELIETINAAGTSQSKIEYSAIDIDAPRNKTIYYKLTLIDKDGTEKKQFVVSVANCSKDILVYPNPSNSIVTAQFEANDEVEYEIYNMIGQSVRPEVQVFNDKLVFDFTYLEQGVYHLRFLRNGETEHHSVVIMAK